MDVYLIDTDKCTMCGLCLDACKDFAIKGEKATKFGSGYLPYEIAQKRCTNCGECLKVCPEGAVLLISTKEMAETPDTKIMEGVGKEAANDAKEKLEAAGAVIDLE